MLGLGSLLYAPNGSPMGGRVRDGRDSSAVQQPCLLDLELAVSEKSVRSQISEFTKLIREVQARAACSCSPDCRLDRLPEPQEISVLLLRKRKRVVVLARWPPRRHPGPASSRRWRARHGELDVTVVKSGRGLESNAGDLADVKPAIAFHCLSRAALGDRNPLPVERDRPENSMSFQIRLPCVLCGVNHLARHECAKADRHSYDEQTSFQEYKGVFERYMRRLRAASLRKRGSLWSDRSGAGSGWWRRQARRGRQCP